MNEANKISYFANPSAAVTSSTEYLNIQARPLYVKMNKDLSARAVMESFGGIEFTLLR